VRMEDATLEDLYNLCRELLDRVQLPAGPHFLVGSVSHLQVVGTSIYCQDWMTTNNNFTTRWRSCTLGPLPPIITGDTEGKVLRSLVELNSWLSEVYGNKPQYPRDAWDKLISSLNSKQEIAKDLGFTDTYIVALPVSLTDKKLRPVNFNVSSSLAVTTGLDSQATFELVGVLVDLLNSDFSCMAHSEDLVFGELAEQEHTDDIQNSLETGIRIILLGGSHLSRSLDHFTQKGYTVVNLTKPGWLPTNENITHAMEEIKKLGSLSNSIAVVDLVSNVAFRYEQLDGQQLLAQKKGGRYHMLGGVTTCAPHLLKNILFNLRGLLDLLTCEKIFVSPLPRYLFTSCCEDETHCPGVGEQGYALELLNKSNSLRRVLRDTLTAHHSRVTVPELYNVMFESGTSPGAILSELRSVYSGDGVHLTDRGYEIWVGAIIDCIKSLANVQAKKSPTTGYFWRGFVSPVGSERPKNAAAHHGNRSVRGGGGKWAVPRGRGRGRPTPYNKK
jgi:hypothetical protein